MVILEDAWGGGGAGLDGIVIFLLFIWQRGATKSNTYTRPVPLCAIGLLTTSLGYRDELASASCFTFFSAGVALLLLELQAYTPTNNSTFNSTQRYTHKLTSTIFSEPKHKSCTPQPAPIALPSLLSCLRHGPFSTTDQRWNST